MRIGARGSKLSLIQTGMVADLLRKDGVEVEIVRIRTRGDTDLVSPMYEMGSTGIFVEEINARILDGEIDAAVHSAKDIPFRIQEGLAISAVLQRDVPWDALVSDFDLGALPSGSVVGTSSLRRKMEILKVRDDLLVENIRGNVETRIGKMTAGQYGGILMAAAALRRIGYEGKYEVLDRKGFLPAPNQGIIAAVSAVSSDFTEILEKIDHKETRICMENERMIMGDLNLGCSVPAGIYCSPAPEHKVSAMIFSGDGTESEFMESTIRNGTDLEEFTASMRKKVGRLGY
ncbi:MAG: hydroxymethylbilane synthase [Thermoplasmataceae archaeon]